MIRILIVEDERVVRRELARVLKREGYEVLQAGSLAEAAQQAPGGADLIVTDLRLPDGEGTALLDAGPPVIVMTSFSTVEGAVAAMKRGAKDYLSKPFDPEELRLLVAHTLKGERRPLPAEAPAPAAAAPARDLLAPIVAESEAMKAVLRRVQRVAPTDATVLIQGESGTGKELIARAIHGCSTRSGGPFVPVNCGAIAEGLIESELFGHTRGAFTGAEQARTGLIGSAHGGTLFLDEVGELPAAAQSRLLRVLQESEVRAVGANRATAVDVRVIAATHRNLPRMVAEGGFREDLYFRLRVLDIHVPPLRERLEEIEALAARLLERHRAGDPRPLCFSPAAIAAMRAHSWPGNVRELDNAIERARILSDGPVIEAEQLGIEPRWRPEAPEGQDAAQDPSLSGYFRRFLLAHQAELSETELARRLGISRKTLWERRQRMGIPRPTLRFVTAGGFFPPMTHMVIPI